MITTDFTPVILTGGYNRRTNGMFGGLNGISPARSRIFYLLAPQSNFSDPSTLDNLTSSFSGPDQFKSFQAEAPADITAPGTHKHKGRLPGRWKWYYTHRSLPNLQCWE
jgi:hypothetical protein